MKVNLPSGYITTIRGKFLELNMEELTPFYEDYPGDSKSSEVKHHAYRKFKRRNVPKHNG